MALPFAPVHGAFRRLMTHAVVLVTRQRDAFGSWTDASATELKGFVEYAQRRVVARDGEETAVTGTVYLPGGAGIDPGGEYAVEHEGRRYRVVSIERLDDPRTGATHHFELGIL